VHYLCKKATSQSLPIQVIADVDLYKYDPWHLRGNFSFFFSKICSPIPRMCGYRRACSVLLLFTEKRQLKSNLFWLDMVSFLGDMCSDFVPYQYFLSSFLPCLVIWPWEIKILRLNYTYFYFYCKFQGYFRILQIYIEWIAPQNQVKYLYRT